MGRAADRLRDAIELGLPTLRAAATRLLSAEPAETIYREYLATMHATVRASVPLMQAALARARELAADDPVARRLVDYLPEHIEEEAGHDDWLLDDLEAIGVPRYSILTRTPSRRIAAVVGAQYYWILHGHPVALIGYMAVLERHAPSPAVIDRLVDRTGFDRRAFRTMIEHADLDRGHAEDVFRVADAVPARDRLVDLLESSAVHTVLGMAAVLDEIVDRRPSRAGDLTAAKAPRDDGVP